MKNLFFKSLTAIFLIVALCSLTACGGGGGGGGSDNHSSSEPKEDVQTVYEQTSLQMNINSVISNLSTLLPTTSLRASITLSDNIKTYATGQKLEELINHNTIDSFVADNNISNVTKINDNFCYGNKNGLRIAFFKGTDNINIVLTRIAADSTGLVAVSYLNDTDGKTLSTFCYAVDKNKILKGKTFNNKKDNVTFETENNFNSSISGDDKSIIYVNSTTGEQTAFDTNTGKEESMSDALNKLPIKEKHGIGAMISPLVKYKDFLFGSNSNSQRATSAIPESFDLNIPESLKKYLSIEEIDKAIPHNSNGHFIHDWSTPYDKNTGKAHPNMHERKFFRDYVGDENDNSGDVCYMKMATVPANEMTDEQNNNLNLSSDLKLAMVCIYSNIEDGKGFGKTPLSSKLGEGEDNTNIRVKLISDTKSNYAVGYCYINNGYDGGGYEEGHLVKSTFCFVMRTDGKKIVGRTFDGIKSDNLSYNTESGFSAKVYGDDVKYTYAPVNGTEETLDYQWDAVANPSYNNQSDNY